VPGPQGPAGAQGPQGIQGVPGPAGVGVPAGGTAGQILSKIDGVNYNTAWVNNAASAVWGNITGTLSNQTDLQTALNGKYSTSNPAGYITSSALTPYLLIADAESSFYPLTGNPSAFLTSASLTGYATESWVTAGFYPLTGNPSGFLTSAALTPYLTSATAASTYFPIPTGNTTQYIAGDGTLITFPTLATANKLTATVYNQSGSTIVKGAVVYIDGAHGNLPTIALSQANAESTSAGTYGFVAANIGNNSSGTIVIAGVAENLDTSALADGDKLYLSPTVAGGYTTTKPSAPNHMVYLGVVTRAHPTQGTIQTRIANGFELDELHDVAIASKTNNDLLAYESSTNLWKNKSFGTLGLATQSFVTGQGYITSSALTPYLLASTASATYQTLAGMSDYLSKAGNLAGLASTSTARTNLGLGSLDSPIFGGLSVANAVTAYSFTGTSNQSTLHSLKLNDSAGLTFSNLTTQTTAYPGPSGFLLKADNLSGLANTATARTNLGLGTAAVEPATKLVPAGGTTGQVLAKSSATDWDDAWITIPSAPVTSVAGKTGAVTLVVGDVSGAAPTASPTFSGTVTIPSGASISGYLTTAAGNAAYYPLTGNPSGFLTSAPVTSVAGKTGIVTLVAADVSGAVTTAAANTYPAGAKQTVSHSSTTAGFNIAPVAGNPTTLANGDIWLNSTTNALNARAGGANHQLNTVKAWVNFNGQGTVAIRSSFNVSSITDNGVGEYTVNLTTALSDINYVPIVATNDDNVNATYGYEKGTAGQYRTTTAFRLYIFGSPNLRDASGVYVAIIR